jgi:tRNA nucleotidyltransferase (CCA-adding enzyme)
VALLSTPELRARAESLPAVSSLLGGEHSQPVFLVGGAVRDLLLERDPLDLDLAVDGPLGELAQRLDGTPEIHDRFGTATVTRDGVRYDIAQTRAERYAEPGALPEVRPAPILEDLQRRDFTVNAMALGLTGPQAGELIAVDGALRDLEARRLEVLHDQSFVDDPTRLLRLARYAVRLDFRIAPHTRELAEAAVADGALATVSGSRIGNELRLLAAERDPVAAFAGLSELGLDSAIDKALAFGEERQRLARAALAELPSDGSPAIVVLGVALLGTEPRVATALLDRLEFTAADREAIVDVTRASRLNEALETASTGSEIARAIGNAGVAMVALAAAQVPSWRHQQWLQTLRDQQLQITGDDLIGAGIKQGPELGRRLAKAQDALWDGSAPDRESQLKVALA